MSQYCRPSGVLVPSPSTLVGPPVAGAADLLPCARVIPAASTINTSIPCLIICSPQVKITSRKRTPGRTGEFESCFIAAASFSTPVSCDSPSSSFFLGQRDHINLDKHVLRKPRHLDGRSRRRCCMKKRPIHFVHRGEITHVLQKHGCAHHLLQARASRTQNS